MKILNYFILYFVFQINEIVASEKILTFPEDRIEKIINFELEVIKTGLKKKLRKLNTQTVRFGQKTNPPLENIINALCDENNKESLINRILDNQKISLKYNYNYLIQCIEKNQDKNFNHENTIRILSFQNDIEKIRNKYLESKEKSNHYFESEEKSNHYFESEEKSNHYFESEEWKNFLIKKPQ